MNAGLEPVIRISPAAKVLPANTLRFYLHFPRPSEAHFDRNHLWLLNNQERVVAEPFLVLSQELWSVDGRRLTILMEPGRIKRGLGTDPSHEPALVVGRTYSLVITALGQTARHTFRVSDPVLEAVDETQWRVDSPTVGSLEPAVVHFDRVMDAALCQDEIAVLTASGKNRPRRRCYSHRTEPQRSSYRANRGAPASTASSRLNVSKTFVATDWVRLWTTSWARVDRRGAGMIKFTTR